MKKKVRIGIALGTLVVLLGIIGVVFLKKKSVHDWPAIVESGRLSVLADSSSMGFATQGDSVFGFQYEIVKAFADTMGLELEITEQNDMNVCAAGLKSGDYDIVANLIPITTEWKNELLFTVPLLTSRQVLVQQIPKDSTGKTIVRHQNELAKDTIYIPLHSPYKMTLNHLSNDIADTIHIIELKNLSPEQMVRMVANGRIKYTICDERFAQTLRIKYPNIDVSLPVGFMQQHGWAVHSESTELLAKLNAFLQDFIGSSAFWEIYRKYH